MCADVTDVMPEADPLNAELFGATFAAIADPVGGTYDRPMIEGIIPAFTARGSSEALAALLAIGSVAGQRVAEAAMVAADHLAGSGVAPPQWAQEIREPVTVGDCLRISDSEGVSSVLVSTFHRAGRSHAFVITVDQLDCGAASEIFLIDAESVPDGVAAVRADLAAMGLNLAQETVDPANFRWHCEDALDARAVHDAVDQDMSDDPELDPEFGMLATLLRARLATLPVPGKPKMPHGGEDEGAGLEALEELFQAPSAAVPTAPRNRQPKKLRPKRKRSNGLAPVFQIKVCLPGAEPPIWRRLEVPADISLARLHDVIQLAFGREDSCPYIFDTPYGQFGGFGERGPEDSVALERVVARAGSKIRHVYDVDDDWDHELVVEKVVAREEDARYPRCTGGGRAAPAFDVAAVNRALERLR